MVYIRQSTLNNALSQQVIWCCLPKQSILSKITFSYSSVTRFLLEGLLVYYNTISYKPLTSR
jgi:hypothetical protein